MMAGCEGRDPVEVNRRLLTRRRQAEHDPPCDWVRVPWDAPPAHDHGPSAQVSDFDLKPSGPGWTESASAEGEAETSSETPESTEPEPDTSWVEVYVTDEAGEAMRNVVCKVEAADGTVCERRTNGSGYLRVTDLVQGDVTITLPDYDGSAVELA